MTKPMTTITNDWVEHKWTLKVGQVEYDVKCYVYLTLKEAPDSYHWPPRDTQVADYSLEGFDTLPEIADAITVRGRYSARELLNSLNDPARAAHMQAMGWNLEELRTECEKSIASHEKEIERQLLVLLEEHYGQ